MVSNEQFAHVRTSPARPADQVSEREQGEDAIEACHQAQGKFKAASQRFDALYALCVTYTHHERDMLLWICRGWGIKQIAAELGIGVGTTGSHVRRLCAKAHVQSREQLIVYTMQQPASLHAGAECKRGIHQLDSACPCPHCRAILAA
jgi:DNA-binding CsgD family transcriptional regulator